MPARSFDDDPPPPGEVPWGNGHLLHAGVNPAAARAQRVVGYINAWNTPGQRRRAKRDLLIALCYECGISARFISEALLMSRTHVNGILTATRRKYAGAVDGPHEEEDA